jgi:hypothetical protein
MIWGQLVEHRITGARGRIAPFLNGVVVEFNEFFSDGVCIKVRTTPASSQELIESWRFVDEADTQQQS